MAATLQNTNVSCRGGLDLRSTTQELLDSPGAAAILENFECVSAGGYRRINGYADFGVNPVPGAGDIKGIHIFNNSILVAKDDALYHTFDASTWVQVNKAVSGADLATIQAAPAVPMDANVTRVRFAHYTHGTADEVYHVAIVNGYDELMHFSVEGTDHNTAIYSFEYLDEGLTSAPSACTEVFSFRDQIYVSGKSSDPSTVYVSAMFDVTDWTGTNSLQVSTADPITGLYSFRENMIVFCENSIYSLSGVYSGQANLQPITKNIGCVHGDTIQEINGDLIYLAPDGLRTLAATQRIDDVELSSVSSKIQELINDMFDELNDIEFHSVVLREKSQYRLYYPYKDTSKTRDKGLIGTLVYGPNGSLSWNWSETKNLPARHCVSGLFNGQYISLMTTGTDGLLYQHDTGSTFGGSRIQAIYSTHYFHMGDSSVRKNLHRIRTHLKPEGQSNIELRILSTGYTNELQHNPNFYYIDQLFVPAIYGQSEYAGGSIYGGQVIDSNVNNVEGSGFTFSITYTSTNLNDTPYNIQGFDLDFAVGGKV